MTPAEVLRHRLINQNLAGSTCRLPADVVARLGAMQAQEYAMAKWAIGLRCPGSTHETVEQALDAGEILRTHVLRSTWHFVAPADIRWMLELTAPRVRLSMQYMDRKLEVDRSFLKRCHRVIATALKGNSAATRDELAAILKKAKLAVAGPRLAHVFIHAELDGLICSGPRRSGKATYLLLEDRVPSTKPLTRDDALAELSRRYFASHGPATVKDFSWWSGLTLRDAALGIESLGQDFCQRESDGRVYVLPTRAAPEPLERDAYFYLPDYDEYGIAYKDRSALFAESPPEGIGESWDSTVAFNRMIVVEGKMVGSWRRVETKTRIEIERKLFGALSKSREAKLARAAERYASFWGKSVSLAE